MIRIMMIKSVVAALVFFAAKLRSKYFMPSSFFIKFPAFKTLLYCHITTPELLLLSGHLESFSCFLGVVFLEGIGELGDLWPQSQSSPWPTSEAAGGFRWTQVATPVGSIFMATEVMGKRMSLNRLAEFNIWNPTRQMHAVRFGKLRSDAEAVMFPWY